jgi:hypothetical protein
MPLKCIVIDDEPFAIEVLKRYIAKLPSLQLLRRPFSRRVYTTEHA